MILIVFLLNEQPIMKTTSLYWYHNAKYSQSHVTKMKSPLLQFMSRLENCMKLIWIGSFNVYISDIIDEQCFVSYKKEQVQTFFSNFAFRDLKKKLSDIRK